MLTVAADRHSIYTSFSSTTDESCELVRDVALGPGWRDLPHGVNPGESGMLWLGSFADPALPRRCALRVSFEGRNSVRYWGELGQRVGCRSMRPKTCSCTGQTGLVYRDGTFSSGYRVVL